jgi:hypothetical protein
MAAFIFSVLKSVEGAIGLFLRPNICLWVREVSDACPDFKRVSKKSGEILTVMTEVLFLVSKSLMIDLKCVSFIVVLGTPPFSSSSTSAYSASLWLKSDFC